MKSSFPFARFIRRLPPARRLPGALAACALILGGMAVSAPAGAALALGAKAPDFTTRGALGGRIFTLKLSDALKKGPVVLYFFPRVFTEGCTAEARAFVEAMDDFRRAGATVIGMSADPVDRLRAFSVKECGGKFAVGSAGPSIIREYDVAFPGRPEMTDRTSYVIAPTGRIAYVHSEMNYADHVRNTLKAVQNMGRAKR